MQRIADALARMLRVFESIHRLPPHLTIAVAAVVLTSAFVVGLRTNIADRLDWRWAGVAVVLAVLQLPLSVLEYRAAARISGVAATWSDALGVVVVGSALNMLPLPGGIAVRLAALKSEGVSASTSSLALATLALIWIGMASLIAAAASLALRAEGLLYVFVAVAAASLTAGVLLYLRVAGTLARVATPVLIETAFVVLASIRIWTAFQAISFTIGIEEAAVMASSSAFASTFRWVPGAWGVWEGLATLLAVVVSVPAGIAFLASVLTRLCSYATTGAALTYHAAARRIR